MRVYSIDRMYRGRMIRTANRGTAALVRWDLTNEIEIIAFDKLSIDPES